MQIMTADVAFFLVSLGIGTGIQGYDDGMVQTSLYKIWTTG